MCADRFASGRMGFAMPVRPNPEELRAAAGRAIPDVVAHGLDVLFCGINPSLWSGAVGHHFARPGNRFWRVLHGAGFSPEVLQPSQADRFLELGFGLTNLVNRATVAAAELSREELVAGSERLLETACRWAPKFVAVVGMGAYRVAFGRPKAPLGRQRDLLGPSALWLLPNPSGLQATYQLPELIAAFSELRQASLPDPPPRRGGAAGPTSRSTLETRSARAAPRRGRA